MTRIRDVAVLDGFMVRLSFTDGTDKIVDLEPYLKGEVFQPLMKDRRLFSDVRVDPELGTIVWPNGADIDPDVLYHGRVPASWESPTVAG